MRPNPPCWWTAEQMTISDAQGSLAGRLATRSVISSQAEVACTLAFPHIKDVILQAVDTQESSTTAPMTPQHQQQWHAAGGRAVRGTPRLGVHTANASMCCVFRKLKKSAASTLIAAVGTLPCIISALELRDALEHVIWARHLRAAGPVGAMRAVRPIMAVDQVGEGGDCLNGRRDPHRKRPSLAAHQIEGRSKFNTRRQTARGAKPPPRRSGDSTCSGQTGVCSLSRLFTQNTAEGAMLYLLPISRWNSSAQLSSALFSFLPTPSLWPPVYLV
jgi:hypothetical protein